MEFYHAADRWLTAMTAGSEYARQVGARLRAVRKQRGLSLPQVEKASAGQFTAVTLRTYECAERNLTVAKLASLAVLYGVPVAELLPDTVSPPVLAAGMMLPHQACRDGEHSAYPGWAYPGWCECHCHQREASHA